MFGFGRRFHLECRAVGVLRPAWLIGKEECKTAVWVFWIVQMPILTVNKGVYLFSGELDGKDVGWTGGAGGGVNS